ncbi:hypothetical protein LXL04_024768 [Taraxacum kok-saghyz]
MIISSDNEDEPEEDPEEDPMEVVEQEEPIEEPIEAEASSFGFYPNLLCEHELPEYDPSNALVYGDESSDESTFRSSVPKGVGKVYPEHVIGTSTPPGFATLRHSEGPLQKLTPRKSVPLIPARHVRTPPPTATGETRRQGWHVGGPSRTQAEESTGSS